MGKIVPQWMALRKLPSSISYLLIPLPPVKWWTYQWIDSQIVLELLRSSQLSSPWNIGALGPMLEHMSFGGHSGPNYNEDTPWETLQIYLLTFSHHWILSLISISQHYPLVNTLVIVVALTPCYVPHVTPFLDSVHWSGLVYTRDLVKNKKSVICLSLYLCWHSYHCVPPGA